MTDIATLSSAIGAHGAWKLRLVNAIDTGSDVSTPDKVRVDNACDFGKWLYGADAATRSDLHYAKVKDLHAQFHRAAAEVLAIALAGRQADARAAVAVGSPYAAASASLTNAMMQWRQTLAS